MQALHFGSGNIGLGFIGRTLSESGFKVIFSDINQDIVNYINRHQNYSVIVAGKNQKQAYNIINISAINANNSQINKVIAEVDLITTASGPAALELIALTIANGIIFKCQIKSVTFLNIIACENKIKASSYLKNTVLKKLPKQYHDYLKKYIGFVDCTIDTIIPKKIDFNQSPLNIIAENFQEWIANPTQFKGNIPKINSLRLSNNLDSFIERKLFTLNTGHVIAAYLGLIKKYKTIQQVMSDYKICNIVKLAMQESGAFLVKHFNFHQKEHDSYINQIFFRFNNPFLSDDLERIGRNPIQKLGTQERLIKPFLSCIKHQLPCKNLAIGIASAFYFFDKNDLESVKISYLIKQKGIETAISEICDLNDSNAKHLIVSEYQSILKTIF
ncbi:mannitol-1-phosphate 5-dehydrogenase [Buchnera aphidicola (Hyadaphis tataricae)]|uniref:Mannitol-1-phosphate 5-dehydrogenase n=1 Tax=Buchnera aphidicola (Hyadaphis tataricae) TaxID=1241859 RepID=A0A4D6Y7J3_9GAMM|nr:mannitol-1-phosphate 5-dehydrogenase [Buchnera aphidicola]QCI21840.1 mannitol-1-phosphate 5-dehydrogenase [Buchnera aphidicola (Hyadaphis tataricae)]